MKNGCHNCTHYHAGYFNPHFHYCDFDGIEYGPDHICENHNAKED